MKKNIPDKRFYFGLVLFFISFLLLETSCKKEEKKIKVWGYVADASGNKVSGVRVNLQGTLLEGGSYSSGFSDIASSTSNTSGNYDISTEWKVVYKYKIKLFKQNYFDNSYEYLANDIPSGAEVNKNLVIHPVAWIKIVVNNVNPYDDNDQISYKYDENEPFNCYDCCNNSSIVGNGMLYSNVLVCKLKGNATAKVMWVVKKDNIIQSYSQNIFCNAFDTTEVSINY